MAVDFKVLEQSVSPDGDYTILDEFSPDNGQIWYIDTLRVTVETSSSEEKSFIQAGVRPSSATVDDMRQVKNYRVFVKTTQEDFTFTEQVGKYLYDSQTFYVGELNQGTSADLIFEVEMRRIV